MALTCKATRKYMILETSDAITQHWQNFVFTCGDVDLRDQYVVVDGEGVADVIQDAPQFLYHCNICGLQLDSSQVLIDHWRTCSENRCIMGKYPFQIH